MTTCPNCSASADADANFCVSCGRRLPVACPGCGAANLPDSSYCHYCGQRLDPWTQEPTLPLTVPVSCPRCRSLNEHVATFCYSCGLPLEEFGGGRAGPATAPGAIGTPAGFWIRLLAWAIDSVVLLGMQFGLLAVLPGTSIAEYYADNALWSRVDTLMVLVGAAYYTVAVAAFSTTFGKRALGLYVLRPDGSRIGGLRAFARYLAGGLSGILLGIGYLMIGFNSDKRGLHDHICDTVVVKR